MIHRSVRVAGLVRHRADAGYLQRQRRRTDDAMWLKLTNAMSGEDIHVNMDHVVHFEADKNGNTRLATTNVLPGSGAAVVVVAQKFEDIIIRLR